MTYRMKVGLAGLVVFVIAGAVLAALLSAGGDKSEGNASGSENPASSAQSPEDECYAIALNLVHEFAQAINDGYPGGIDFSSAIVSQLGINESDLQVSRVAAAVFDATNSLQDLVAQGSDPVAAVDRVEPYIDGNCYDRHGTWARAPGQGLVGLL